jgi:hypothetical protein
MDASAKTMKFEIDNESDTKKKDQKKAILELALAAREEKV